LFRILAFVVVVVVVVSFLLLYRSESPFREARAPGKGREAKVTQNDAVLATASSTCGVSPNTVEGKAFT